MPRKPLLDFKEDLNAYLNARKPKTDVRLRSVLKIINLLTIA